MLSSTWGLLLRAIKKGLGCPSQEAAGMEGAVHRRWLKVAGLMLCKQCIAVC